MANVKTLKDISDLKRSRFGRPSPRHGLKLLYWFANDYVSFDGNNMVSWCDPRNEKYGFHKFENRCQRNGMKLLPEVDLPYYVAGNLFLDGSNDFPDYVTKEKTGLQDYSNTDRIIVRLDDNYYDYGYDYDNDNDNEVCFDEVYITTHMDKSNFDPYNTYRISEDLLMKISKLDLDMFLYVTGYSNKQPASPSTNSVGVAPNVIRENYPVPPVAECKIKIEDLSPLSNNNTKRQSKGFWDNFCTIL